MRFAPALLGAAALALAGCATAPAPVAATIASTRAPLTIMVSIDGFRPDYLHRGRTPRLDALAAGGVAGTMKPSFPTVTFPNHLAIATGLRPDRTGMVENRMHDPARPHAADFDIHDAATAHDPFWWNGAEPIWVAAEKAGLRTGMMYWPGSDVAIRDVRPRDWFPYDPAVTGEQRVGTVLDWARRPATERPRFIGLYFDTVDRSAHANGWSAPATLQAVAEVDRQIGRLVDGLAAMGRPADIVIVSDHGMEDVAPDHVLPLAAVVDPSSMEVMARGGPILSIWPRPGQEAAAAARLLAPHPHIRCWRKAELPTRWHFGTNPRAAPFFCLAESGWRTSADPPRDHPVGDHGFDNDDPQMTALFIANGPAFLPRRTLPRFDNVDVYPLLRDLIGLPAMRNIDGSDAPFRPVLRR